MKQLKVCTVFSVIIAILSIVFLAQGDEDINFNSLYERILNDSLNSNWTNCTTFLADSRPINISSIVDIDWNIFYFWSFDEEFYSYTLRFSVPSDLLVQRVRESLHFTPEPPVNWSQAELFLDTSVEINCLLIRTGTPGLYRFIPTMDMDVKTTTEIFFALKQVDGYLGIVNCWGKMAYAMAPVYRMPKSDEIPELVAKFNFWNPFGRSYLEPISTPPPFDMNLPTDLDDDGEDQILQIHKSKEELI